MPALRAVPPAMPQFEEAERYAARAYGLRIGDQTDAYGPLARALLEIIRDVVSHQRGSVLGGNTAELSEQGSPWRRSTSFVMRIAFKGPGKPLHYMDDDE